MWDPWVSPEAAREEYGLDLVATPETGAYDGVILAVAHREFLAADAAPARGYGRPNATVYDVKAALPRDAADLRL